MLRLLLLITDYCKQMQCGDFVTCQSGLFSSIFVRSFVNSLQTSCYLQLCISNLSLKKPKYIHIHTYINQWHWQFLTIKKCKFALNERIVYLQYVHYIRVVIRVTLIIFYINWCATTATAKIQDKIWWINCKFSYYSWMHACQLPKRK